MTGPKVANFDAAYGDYLGGGIGTAAQEIANRGAWKQPVRVATTAAGTLASSFEAGDTIDGVVLADGDRILVKDQADATENGIYVVAATGTPDRASDADTGSELLGALVAVLTGTANVGLVFHNTNTTAPALGTDAVTFAGFGSFGITVEEEDGVPSVTGATTLQVPNDGLTNDGSGTVSLRYALPDYGGKETVQSHGSMGATETINLANGNSHAGTLDASCAFTFSGATSGVECSFILELTEDATGGWLPGWPSSIVWPGGTAPTHTTTPASVSIYLFRTRDGGTTWYGFAAGGTSTTTSSSTSGTGDHLHAVNEPLTANGSDATYYLANYPEVDTVAAYIAGVRVDVTQALDAVTFGTVPAADVALRFDYLAERT